MFFGLFGKKEEPFSKWLEPGQELELELSENNEKRVYLTDLISIGSKSLALSFPLGEENRGVFAPGKGVDVHAEIGGKVASFYVFILSSDSKGLNLSLPEKIEWKEKTESLQQRRNFVRFETALSVFYAPFQGVKREGTTLDISGNGLSMVNELELKSGTILPIALKLLDKEIKCKAKVIRSKPYSKSIVGQQRYETAVSFVDIETKDQDSIVKYIFDKQRELRRRGII